MKLPFQNILASVNYFSFLLSQLTFTFRIWGKHAKQQVANQGLSLKFFLPNVTAKKEDRA
jgi:hypothetical protein